MRRARGAWRGEMGAGLSRCSKSPPRVRRRGCSTKVKGQQVFHVGGGGVSHCQVSLTTGESS